MELSDNEEVEDETVDDLSIQDMSDIENQSNEEIENRSNDEFDCPNIGGVETQTNGEIENQTTGDIKDTKKSRKPHVLFTQKHNDPLHKLVTNKNGKLLVRRGGGWNTIDEYLKTHEPKQVSKLKGNVCCLDLL